MLFHGAKGGLFLPAAFGRTKCPAQSVPLKGMVDLLILAGWQRNVNYYDCNC